METPKHLKPILYFENDNQNHLLKNVFDSLRQAIVIIDKKLIVRFHNQIANHFIQRAFGQSIKVGDSIMDFILEANIDSYKKMMEDVLAGEKVSFIKDMTNPDGDILWFEISFNPVIEQDDEVDFIIIHGIDITRLKFFENKVDESERRYKAIVQSQSELICRFTIDGIINFVNSAYCKFFNATENEILGSNFFHRVPDFQRGKVKFDIMALTPGNPNNNYIEKIIGKEGNIRWISGTNMAIFDNDGNIIEIQNVAKDITELKNVEQELIREIERAEESDKLKSNFLANISHEIRTPLNGILGFSGLIKSTQFKKEKLDNYCDLIEKSGRHLLEIIDDMLEVSMIETHQLKFHYTNVYLPDIFNNIQEFVKKSIRTKSKGNIELKRVLPPSGPKFFKIDGIRLYQIFIKLLNNAFKYTSEGYVEFGYYQPNATTFRFFVRDTGIGIPKDKQRIIFMPFRQAEEMPTRCYGGTGLGLTIVKALVESMGGKIYLVSEPGTGSNFYFDLPVIEVETEKPETQTMKVAEKEYDWHDLKILIVEDIQMNYLVLKEFLRNTNAEIIPAESGTEALDSFKKYPDIDIVLLDIRLPDISGYEIAQRIKEMKSNITIIAQTAYALDTDQLEAHKSGCDSVLVKPIDKEILLKTINDSLKGK